MDTFDYFKQYANYFWQWEEQFSVVAIPEGNTIAYWEQIDSLLRQFSNATIPTFGSFLLTIIATSPNAESSLNVVERKIAAHAVDETLLVEAFSFLKELANLPVEVKNSSKKGTFLRFIFENGHNNLSVKKSSSLLEFIKNPDWTLNSLFSPIDANVIKEDLRIFSILYKKYPTKDDILKAYSRLVDVAEDVVELTTIASDAEIFNLEMILENEKTWKIGSILPFLWSGLNIPFHTPMTGNQPLGGVSDISKKGSYDRLLVSEFANDDLIFLSRLANNEALFYQRESPPEKSLKERIFLIDTSLYTWGTPKILALSVAIAVAKHPKTKISSKFFLLGNNYKEITVNSVESIIEANESVSIKLNAASALQEYFMKEKSSGAEVFFLTDTATFKQAEILKVFSQTQGKINYIITTDDKGKVEVFRKLQQNKKLIQTIEIPIDDIWKKKASEYNESLGLHVRYQGDLPIFVNVNHRASIYQSYSLKAIYAISRSQSLLVHSKPFDSNEIKTYNDYKAWDLITFQLPIKGERCFGENTLGEDVLLLYDTQNNDGCIYNITTKQSYSFFLEQMRGNSGIVFEDGEFKIYTQQSCWIVDPDNGKVSSKQEPKYQHEIQQINKQNLPFVYMSNNLLENLTSVSINAENRLVFCGKHVLGFNINGSHKIKIYTKSSSSLIIHAHKLSENLFQFPDGSTVELKKTGVFILRSSDDNIPLIFIPSEIDKFICAATYDTFTGPEYYYKQGESVESEEFYSKYIHGFIETVNRNSDYGN